MNHPEPALRLAADIASRRHAAVAAFITRARQLLDTGTAPGRDTLQPVARALEQLGLQAELFPVEHFPVSAQKPAQVYRLAEDLDGRFALYVVGGQARELPPSQDHIWTRIESPPGLHLHFCGRTPSRLTQRVGRESALGSGDHHVGLPKHIGHAAIAPAALKAALSDGQEIALLDVRETGVFVRSHLLLAASAPLWRLELSIARQVPRRDTRIVLTDGGEDGDRLAHAAAAKLVKLGWRNVSVLQGGVAAWAAAGHEVFSGSNVPSKAFGEVIEHDKHTPWIDADELQRRIAAGEDIVVVDSRTTEEFADFSLPFAHSLPGAELVYRIQELAPRPETLVVVNCAGRTRSIVGAQTLIDAGLPNRVVSLKDGTMAWLLAGRMLAQGRHTPLPEPGEAARASARERAEAVAARAGVRRIGAEELARFEAEAAQHTLYRFDIRTRAEYEAGHVPGWRWAPGGQLVQATDEHAPTRHARIVLADWDGVRALTTAAWLAQLGGHAVFVFAPPPLAAVDTGPEPLRVLATRPPAPTVSPLQADALLKSGLATVYDVERRSAFEKRHIADALFAVPDRLEGFVADLVPAQVVVITSSDGVLARTVAAELAARSGRDVRALAGGTSAWVAAGLATRSGADGVLTGDDDHWYSPYQHADVALRNAGFQAYLDWEIGLVAQLQREGDIGIRLIDR